MVVAPMIRYPILAFCEGWLQLFKSKQDAEKYIEPIDVQNGAWVAFDTEGKVLDLAVEQEATRGIWALFTRSEEVVRICDTNPPVVDSKRLQQMIVDYITALVKVEGKGLGLDAQSFGKMSFAESVVSVMELYSRLYEQQRK